MKATMLAEHDHACPMNYPGFVFRELRKKGYRAEPLLNGTGLTEELFRDPNSKVELAALRLFIQNAIAATGDPHIGPRLAAHFEANYIGPPAYAAMNAPRLVDGLEVLGRFVHLTFSAVEIDFPKKSGDLGLDEAEICLRPVIPLQDMSYFVISSALIVLNNLLKNMLRMPLVASRCETTICEPGGWAEVAGDLSRVPVQFEATKNRIVFPAGLLDQPLPGADPINHHRLVALCERFSAEAAHVRTPVGQVIAYLDSKKNLGEALAHVAAALGYSERGLRRRLEQSGTSYRKIMEQILERRARDMLANSALPIHVISHELGYDTPSNFARSFKRWTGETPKGFRERCGVAANGGQK